MRTVTLVQIPKEDIRQLIENVYAGDDDMRNNYHILSAKPLKAMVDYTYYQATESDNLVDTRYYAICLECPGERLKIGYTVLVFDQVGVLHVFGIEKEWRQEDIKDMWLEAVKKEFDGLPYVLTLRERNKRAIRFFEKKGYQTQYVPDEINKENNYYLLWPQV